MSVRLSAIVLASFAFAGNGLSQEQPKPGPEHEKLKALVGEWDATVKMGPMESKGKATYKLDFGGFFLIEQFSGEFGGMKFKGRGQTGYCPIRKKYVSTWIDSMSPTPMIMTGDFKDDKTMIEEGEGPGMDGKMHKFRTKSVMKDKDEFVFTMYQLDGDK